MNDSSSLKKFEFKKVIEVKGEEERGEEKEKKKLFSKLRKIAQKIGRAVKTFPKVSICVLNDKGIIFYCSRPIKKEVVNFISTYVQKNHEFFPEGSYVIPRSDLSLVVWKLSESVAVAIYTEGGIGPLLSLTPYIMHFSKKIEDVVLKASSLPISEKNIIYEPKFDEVEPEIFPHEVFSFNSQEDEQKSKIFLELFGEEGVKMLREMDGRKTVQEIVEKTGASMEFVTNIIRQAMLQKIVKKVQQYPLVKRLDKGSLLLFGIDPSYVNLYKELRRLCNGKRTLEEIAGVLEIPESKLVNILEKLGKNVEWIKKAE
ncbi:MAG: hypothetical protein QW279_03310 [Candidatus Jordarchaeaceae archaeon]